MIRAAAELGERAGFACRKNLFFYKDTPEGGVCATRRNGELGEVVYLYPACPVYPVEEEKEFLTG
jgi:hypothetical protein